MTLPGLQRASRGVATLAPVKPHRLRLKAPLISFTFDDAPKSAWTYGGEILSRYGFLGTYYCAGDLIGKSHPSLGVFCDEEDISAMIKEGHEVGCHTRSHLNCQTASRAQIERDMASNRKLFAEQFDQSLTSFAYPYGIVTLGAKFAASAQYACARGTREGINRYVTDLTQLKTISIYHGLSLDRARALIEKTRRSRGWLIFYTHDLQPQPSPFGCTSDQFEKIVKLVYDSGCNVLTIRKAMGEVNSLN